MIFGYIRDGRVDFIVVVLPFPISIEYLPEIIGYVFRKGGKDALAWSAVKTMTRQQVQAMPIPALQALFKADAQKLPAYVGTELGGSYMIYKIVKATQPEKLDEEKRKSIRDEYTTIVAQQDVAAYMASLRQRYKIEINTGLVESRDRQ